MRIDILTEMFLPDLGGGALRVFHLAKNCTKEAEVRVVVKSAPNPNKSAPLFEKRDGFKVYRQKTYPNLLSIILTYLTHLDPSTFFTYYLSLRKSYRQAKPDLLQVRQSFALQLAAVLLGKEFRIPIVFEVHRFASKSDLSLGKIGRLYYLFYYTLEKLLARNADAFIAISDVNKKELVAEGFSGDSIFVVPNGIDTKLFKPQKKPRFVKKSEYVLMYFGVIRENEGLGTLIRAMPALLAKIPDLELIVLGGGNLLEESKRQVESLGIQKNVDFHGEVSPWEIADWLSVADLFIYPRKNVPYHLNFLGLKVLEALATGTPMVTADIGILADFVKKHKCGLLFKVDDSISLSETIQKALSDRKMLKILSENAVESVRDMSWNSSSKLLLKAYERLT